MELLDGLDRIRHLTVDGIWRVLVYYSHPQLSASPATVFTEHRLSPSPPHPIVLEVPQTSVNGVTVYFFFWNAVRQMLRWYCHYCALAEHAQIVLTYNGISAPPWLHHGSCAGCKCPHGPSKQATQRMAEIKYGTNPCHRRDVVTTCHDALLLQYCTTTYSRRRP
jgi:hypothetical protein